MTKPVNIIGAKFGRLTVKSRSVNTRRGRSTWECLCECGVYKVVSGEGLHSGKTKSCGCLSIDVTGAMNRSHGLSWTPEWKTWVAMNRRCNDKGQKYYKDYGGRGIKVCDRWKDFALFLKDMGCKLEGMTLDRINVNGDYCPENCRWASKKTQAQNTRRNRYVTLSGKTQTLSAWIVELGLKDFTVKRRIYSLGWDVEKALTFPVRGASC